MQQVLEYQVFLLQVLLEHQLYQQVQVLHFFSLTTGLVKKLPNITRKKKNKKHDKTLMLAKSKLHSIEKLVSQALIDMEISHEEFITILKEKDKYEKMKDNLRSENEKYEIMRLSSVKSKTYVKNY